MSSDTVVAPATPHGRGALAVVRLTGPGTDAVVARVVRTLRPGPLVHGRPRRVAVRDARGDFDDGVCLLRRAPRTYTGEDLCELAIHGNPLLVGRLVEACRAAGARLAAPGEFTRRAVVNGRMDLVAAEAVDQLVRATAEDGARIARMALDGALGRFLAEVRAELLASAAEFEARLDWADDDLALEPDAVLLARLAGVAERCRALAATCDAGRVLVEGARVAIVGAVNAGKSSLFNALVGRPRALVHERPGTTRDVVEARARLGPLEVTLLDTAGERDTDDPVEAAGLALAQELVADADLLLVVLRAGPAGPSEAEARILERTAERRRLVVYNGVDRPDARPAPLGALPTSAVAGTGVDALGAEIVDALGLTSPPGLAIASVRQRDLLLAVADAAAAAVAALPVAGPAVAADAVLRACEEIDHLTGADTRESVLDAVFARFCIGK